MTYLIKAIHGLFGITLLAFAALQFNDPDPLIWVSFYVICALIPLLLIANKFYRPMFWFAIVICSVELFNSAPGAYQYYLHMTEEPLMQSMNPQKPYIEECREFLGVLITLGLIIVSVLIARVNVFKSSAKAA
jgi:archaellum biogenesis protein FlaJ (TadC family)